jgi:hypothetical protein
MPIDPDDLRFIQATTAAAELRLALQRADRAAMALFEAPQTDAVINRMRTLRDLLNTGVRTVSPETAAKDETQLPSYGLSDDLLRMVLLFHSGGPWTPEKFNEWCAVMGEHQCTPKGLCDAIRGHLRRVELTA